MAGMHVLKQPYTYSDINDKEEGEGLNSKLGLKKSYQFSLNNLYPDTT